MRCLSIVKNSALCSENGPFTSAVEGVAWCLHKSRCDLFSDLLGKSDPGLSSIFALSFHCGKVANKSGLGESRAHFLLGELALQS